MRRRPGRIVRSVQPGAPRAPAWVVPPGPDLAPILRIHREHDGFVTFHRKATDGAWSDLVAVRATDLATMFPAFSAALAADSYFSINAFYRSGRGPEQVPGFPPPLRQGGAVRWITSCFADLDIYNNPALTVGSVVGTLIDWQDAGKLPPASMLMRSGRGVWAFWFLRNDDARYDLAGPVRAWPETTRGWRIVQTELGRRLAQLESDAAARDVCRVTRVPGSIHTRAARAVAYWIQGGADGRGFVYTLDELADRLQLSLPRYADAARAALAPPSDAARARGVKGYSARWNFAFRQFETLRAMRGGFRTGTRSRAAWLLASLLRTAPRALRVSDHDGLSAVLELAADCRTADGLTPAPLPRGEAVAAWDSSAGGWMKIRSQTIADWLDIAPEESAQLETWPPASRFSGAARELDLPLRRQRQETRRALLRLYVAYAVPEGLCVSLRALARELDIHGVRASPETIRADLRVLGLAPSPAPTQGKLLL